LANELQELVEQARLFEALFNKTTNFGLTDDSSRVAELSDFLKNLLVKWNWVNLYCSHEVTTFT